MSILTRILSALSLRYGRVIAALSPRYRRAGWPPPPEVSPLRNPLPNPHPKRFVIFAISRLGLVRHDLLQLNRRRAIDQLGFTSNLPTVTDAIAVFRRSCKPCSCRGFFWSETASLRAREMPLRGKCGGRTQGFPWVLPGPFWNAGISRARQKAVAEQKNIRFRFHSGKKP